MRYRLVGFALLSAAMMMCLTVGTVEAQKTKKKTDDTVAGTIEYYKKDGHWRYKILDGDGKTIVMPFPTIHWDTKEDCLKAIADLKSLLNSAKPVEIEEKDTKKTEKKKDDAK
jgi:hypothetical protein